MDTQMLQKTISDMVITGQGILAADESTGTAGKRLASIGAENTEENRRAYRSLLATTPGLGEHISGVILFEETLQQKTDDGATIPQAFEKQNIVVGIKVDKGLTTFASSPNEKITQGLDGLDDRLALYKTSGARFAKWRNVYTISDNTPSLLMCKAGGRVLARYAAICQQAGIVPIVEPEVLMDGTHTIEKCAKVSETVFAELFTALREYNVALEYMILKPNMIIPGKACSNQTNPEIIATKTLKILKRTVPAAIPSINFLSGGQSSEEATLNLNAMNQMGPNPWYLSFSYGRALQEHCLKAWGAKAENINPAQQALAKRVKLNGLATQGKYQSTME